jgi:hypothetical protein
MAPSTLDAALRPFGGIRSEGEGRSPERCPLLGAAIATLSLCHLAATRRCGTRSPRVNRILKKSRIGRRSCCSPQSVVLHGSCP